MVVGPGADAAVLLDVDGVLIPFGSPSGEWGEWTRHPRHEDVVLSPLLMAALRDLPADLYWLTSWSDTANEVICPFVSWPPMRVLDEVAATRRWWKLGAVEQFLALTSYRRVAWLDDDLDQYADEVRASLGALVDAGRVLPVCPDPRRGLSRDDLAAIRAFLAATVAR